jgi:hypothetical protein
LATNTRKPRGLPLTVSREQVTYFATPDLSPFRADRPILLDDNPAKSFFI